MIGQLFDNGSPPLLSLNEHTSSSYGPRTGINARDAGLTVAFAVDYSTAGERLTHKVAGKRFIATPLCDDALLNARRLYRALREHQVDTLNVAGNGIYTLNAAGWSQAQVNKYVFDVLAKVHTYWPLRFIRSGGQTGADQAGLVSALALGIPAIGLYPLGFRRRGADKVDFTSTIASLEAELQEQAQQLRDTLTISA